MEDSTLAWLAKIYPSSNTRFVLQWLSLNLSPEEYCINHVSGGKNHASPSWLVLTNKRLIFTSHNLVNSMNFGECFLEFELENIRDGSFKKKVFFSLGELQIITNRGTTVLNGVPPESGEIFLSSLRTTLKSRNQTALNIYRNDDEGTRENQRNAFHRFQELNKLYHSGEITLEEYAATRTEIINDSA